MSQTEPTEDHIVRKGSLRRKSGLFGGWKTKYVVLDDNSLSVYKDKDLKKVEEKIVVDDKLVVSGLPAKSNKKSPYLEITQPIKKNKKKNYLFKTKDEEDQKAWVSSIRNSFVKPETKIFGVSLSVLSKNVLAYNLDNGLPFIVEKCVEFMKRGDYLDEEGIFRLGGNFERINELKESYDQGKNPNFDEKEDVNAVTGLFKQFFRSLPEPLLLFENYDELILASKDSEEKLRTTLTNTISKLPLENATLFKYLCEFLEIVAAKSEKNKMGVKNLATVFGPNVLKGKNNDPMKIMEDSDLICRTIECCITNHNEIFAYVQPWTTGTLTSETTGTTDPIEPNEPNETESTEMK